MDMKSMFAQKVVKFLAFLFFATAHFVLASQIVEVEYVDTREAVLTEQQKQSLDKLPAETQQQVLQIFEDAKNAKRIYVLRHSSGRSVYRFSHLEDAGNMQSNGLDYYKDLSSGRAVMIGSNMLPDEQVEFGLLSATDWELCAEDTLWIAGYMCLKAVCEKEGLTVWYAPELTLSDGPERYSGLPGLILMAVFEGREKKKIVARKVVVKSGSENIVLPDRPKKLSLEAYRQSMSASLGTGSKQK